MPIKRPCASSFAPQRQGQSPIKNQDVAKGLRGYFGTTKNLEKLAQGSSQRVLIDPSDLETLGKQSITPSNHEASALIEHF